MVSLVNKEEEQADLLQLKIRSLVLSIFPAKTQIRFW